MRAGCEIDPPETSITEGPEKKTKKKRASFEFQSDEPGSTFECRLDAAAFAPCTSAFSTNAKRGKHTFEVRARDPVGNIDPTSAVHTWTVKKKRKKG